MNYARKKKQIALTPVIKSWVMTRVLVSLYDMMVMNVIPVSIYTSAMIYLRRVCRFSPIAIKRVKFLFAPVTTAAELLTDVQYL